MPTEDEMRVGRISFGPPRSPELTDLLQRLDLKQKELKWQESIETLRKFLDTLNDTLYAKTKFYGLEIVRLMEEKCAQ